MSRDVLESEYYKSVDSNAKLPLRWTSIEAIKHQRFSEKSDVWAFGVTCYEIFTEGELPYHEWMNWYVMEMVTEREYKLKQPPRCPADFYEELIRPCLETLPEDRPAFAELVIRATRIAKATEVIENQITGGDRDRDSEYYTQQDANRSKPNGFHAATAYGFPAAEASYTDPDMLDGTETPNAYVEPVSGIVINPVEPEGSVYCDDPTMRLQRHESVRLAGEASEPEVAGARHVQPPQPPARHSTRRGQPPQLGSAGQQQYVPAGAASKGGMALYAPVDGQAPQSPAAVVIERTEELEDGQFVTPLEAQMFKALRLMDDDDAHDHILKIRRLSNVELSKVVEIDGVPWLATEVNLLEELPEESRSAFRQRSLDRAQKLPKLFSAGPHPEIPGWTLVKPQTTVVEIPAAQEETFGFGF